VSTQLLDHPLALRQDIAVAGSDALEVEGRELVERMNVGRHIAVRRQYHGRHAAEHMIAGEQELVRDQQVAYAIGCMTRRMDGNEIDAAESQGLAVAGLEVRNEALVLPTVERRRQPDEPGAALAREPRCER